MKTDSTHPSRGGHGPATILSVSPLGEDHICLRRLCEGACWKACEACTCHEAVRAIDDEQPDVILCEASLPDGNWKDLLEELFHRSNPPNLIVTSRFADEAMWAEVLNLGGYDVLMKPFDSAEVYRVVGFACERHQKQQLKRSNRGT